MITLVGHAHRNQISTFDLVAHGRLALTVHNVVFDDVAVVEVECDLHDSTPSTTRPGHHPHLVHFVIEALCLDLLVQFEPPGHVLFAGQILQRVQPSPLSTNTFVILLNTVRASLRVTML